jgi:hypothetical protein
MIILTCRYCSSSDLKPEGYAYEATCQCCGREIKLWEMKPVISQNGQKPLTTQFSDSELGSTNLTKNVVA